MINITKCLRSFTFAFKGIYSLFRNENNARVHLLASFLVVIAGFAYELNRSEWIWIALAVTLVWICEAINTAIEKLVDLVSPEINPKAGTIKDLAAGAVLLAAIFALIVAGIIFLPKII